MRSLLLILKILVTASLLIHPIESLASSAKINNGKKGLRKNILRDSGNVWDRIRVGMQIPRTQPLSAQALPVNAMGTQKNLLVQTTVLHHGDDANRIKLNAAIRAHVEESSKNKVKSRLFANAAQKQIADVPESAMVQSRIRTRLEFHPKTSKLDTKVATEPVAKHTPLMTKVVATVTTTALKPTAQPAVNDRIGKQIAWYTQRPAYLQQVAERARPYLYHIVSGLSANHLPLELALLPIVESAYQPTAQSPKSAAGLWQFIPSTGLDFDLSQSDRYDERLDIDASTQAAIRFLSQLKHHFNGDWLLALAAYNCGQGRVDDAISSNRANGLPTDYWSLHLPAETQDYVPRFLALSSIFANPGTYGLKLPAIKNEPYFVKVKVERQFDIDYLSKKNLSNIAELADLSYEQFVQINPGYLKPTLETSHSFTLLLPASNANHLHQHLNHVERFLTAEPGALMTSSLLQKKVGIEADDPKKLPVATVDSLVHKQPRFTGPLLSLKLNAHQTTPRIITQPVLTDFQALTVGTAEIVSKTV